MTRRVFGVSRDDALDVASAQLSVNSYLAPFLLLRLRLKSVADVLKGIRNVFFTGYVGSIVW